jgi:formylglycine-generating enzyme required for sulfatase activity
MLVALDAVQRDLRTSERETAPLPGLGLPAPLPMQAARRHPAAMLAAGVGAVALLAWALFALLPDGGSRSGTSSVTAESAPLDLAARQRLHGEADALLALGQALTPAGENAGQRYAELIAADPADAAARNGLARAIELAASQAVQALDEADGARHADLVLRARAHAEASPEAVAALEQRTRTALVERLDAAVASADGRRADALTAAAAAHGSEQPELAQRLARLAALPAAGARVADPQGPPLRWLPASGNAPALAVGETEVTRGQWRAFVTAQPRDASACRAPGNLLGFLSQRDWRDPGYAQDDSHPVVCVSHADARAYAAWLSARTGRSYRLPTAAEWQRISAGQPARGCRDGNVRDRSEGGGDRFDCRDGHAETAPASGPATGPYAIAGLVGNVREWLADCRERGAGNDCAERAVAGSSWRSGTGDALLGVDGADGVRGWTDVGFRVVREIGTDGPPPRAP